MKNGLKTVSFLGAFVKPRPLSEFVENPVINQDVIVSGTVLFRLIVPSGALFKYIR